MLKKFKILIYRNWFIVLAALLISFLSLKNIYLGIFVSLFLYWQVRGSLGQALFFSLLFLPIFYLWQRDVNLSNLNFFLFFIVNYLILKKYFVADWLLLPALLIVVNYFFFLEWLSLGFLIIIIALIVFIYAWAILANKFLSSLILTLIIFELNFVGQFLPFGFWLRTIILTFLTFLLLKFANVIINNNGISPNRS